MDSKSRVLESDLRLGYLCKAGPPVLLGLICLIHIDHHTHDEHSMYHLQKNMTFKPSMSSVEIVPLNWPTPTLFMDSVSLKRLY